MKMFINGDNFGLNREFEDLLNRFLSGGVESASSTGKVLNVFDILDTDMQKCITKAIENIKSKGFENLESQHVLGEVLRSKPELHEKAKDLVEFIEANTIDLGAKYEGQIKFSNGLIEDLERALQIAMQRSVNRISVEDFWEAILVSKNDVIDKTLKSFGVKDRFDIDPELKDFLDNLNEKAIKGQIHKPIARENEIERVIQILTRRSKSNPILIGEAGVGKTAIAEGLALMIVEKDVPTLLKGKTIYSLNLGNMLAGTKFRGEFEDRMKKLMQVLKKHKGEIVLFVDEIHTIMGAGSTDGQLDIANMLKPALANGEISVIGATTLKEYRKYFEKDAALVRRFQPVHVEEPSVEDAIRILGGLKRSFEEHHGVEIADGAIEQAVKLSKKYIKDRFLPDKAIDLVDEACSKVNVFAEEVIDGNELKTLQAKLNEAIKSEKYEDASVLRDKISSFKENGRSIVVDEAVIRNVLSKWVKIPVESLSNDEKERLLNLEELLNQKVLGQEKAVQVVSESLRRAHVGINNPNRPYGNFLFVGSTGVGKTELAKSLAEVLFGSDQRLIRLDMSEYMEKHAVSKIIGSPPGYVGFEDGGGLTEKIRKEPYSVVLLDEIEKAHPEVLNTFLQVFEDGYLVDSKGVKVSFENCVIIATSNAGADLLGGVEENVYKTLCGFFRPEFLNRFDDIVVFNKLGIKELEKILGIYVDQLNQRLFEKKITVEVKKTVKKIILDESEAVDFGARPLRRNFSRMIENKVADLILKSEIKENQKIVFFAEKNELSFKIC